MVERDTTCVLGVTIDRASLATLTSEALRALQGRRPPLVFACANPHSIVTAQGDKAFMSALDDADTVVADGVGVTLMAKCVGLRLGPRITGTDYFVSLMAALEREGGRSVFFFGSSQRVLDLVARRVEVDFPHVRVCGTLSPPYRTWSVDENAKMIGTINACRPDVLWVGMTAPKQEKWVCANRAALDASVIGSIGAVFDYYAGVVQRAPAWLCRAGLEWLYRLAHEPRRLWRRNLLSTPRFVGLVLRQRMRGERSFHGREP